MKKKITQKLLSKGEDPTRIPERFGISSSHIFTLPYNNHLLWIHAASVGETLASFHLINMLLSQDKKLHILFTTTTKTGAQTCKTHPSFGTRLHHQFIPYDTPQWTARFLERWQPKSAVFVESELWPGIINACFRLHIPIMLVNARLSDRSFRRWYCIRPIFYSLFHSLEWISPRSEEDAKRFQSLGFVKIVDIGDLKQEAPLLPTSISEEKRLRKIIKSRFVVVAASTHKGEEDIIINATRQAAIQKPNLLVIIIPRHPDRGPSLAQRFKAPYRSVGSDPSDNNLFWFADTLGELGIFYRIAHCVFIGNSLIPPGGGHNPFESFRLGCPTATGPYMNNWRQACVLLKPHISIVHDTESLKDWILSEERSFPPIKFSQKVTEKLSNRIIDTMHRNSST